MIKKILFLSLFLVLTSLTYAQTTTAPTQQDALDFLNKVAAAYPPKTSTDESGNAVPVSMVFSLDGCNLIMTNSFHFVRTVEVLGNVEYVTLSITINLASVYYTDHLIKSSVPGDIHMYMFIKEFKPNGKEVTDELPATSTNYNQLMVQGLFDAKAPQFIDNNYSDRIWNAVEFLIKACGGGKMKVDTGGKF